MNNEFVQLYKDKIQTDLEKEEKERGELKAKNL